MLWPGKPNCSTSGRRGPQVATDDIGAVASTNLPRIQRLAGEQHVLDHGQVREELRDLKRAGDAARRALVGRQPRDVRAEQLDAPSLARQLPADHVEQRRLARTVRPDERATLARLDDQADVVYRLEAAEMPGDVLERERREHADG